MNKKRTNLLVTGINTVSLMVAYILEFYFGGLYITRVQQEAFDNSVINIFIKNVDILAAILFLVVGISNIILAIQNRKDKKLFFWQMILALLEAWFILCVWAKYYMIDLYDIQVWVTETIFVVVPCVFTIMNLIFSKECKVILMKMVSYISIIIFFGFIALGLEPYSETTLLIKLNWNDILIVMQIVYILMQIVCVCNQDENIVESNKRRNFNIIIYCVSEIEILILIIFMSIYAMLTIRINEGKWDKGIKDLNNSIETLQGKTISDVYFLVVKGNKYGFINEEGEEKIPCIYDYATKFLEVEYNDDTYYFAMAKKDNNYYVISKDNDSKIIKNDLEKYIRNIENKNGESIINYIFYDILTIGNKKERQSYGKNTKEITLEKENDKYCYKNGIYTIMIEPISDEEVFINNKGEKCKIEIKKLNEEIVSDVVFLPDFEIGSSDAELTIFSDGFIKFVDDDGTCEGWYDYDGKKIIYPMDYRIIDIEKDKIILNKINTQNSFFNQEYFAINKSGEILLKTSGSMEAYNNVYILRENDGKEHLLNDELNTISDGYYFM